MPLLLSERSQAEMNLTERSIMTKKKIQDVTICAACLVLSNCCIIREDTRIK